MIWLIIMSLINDIPREGNEDDDDYGLEYYEALDQSDNEESDNDFQVSELGSLHTYDYLYNIASQSAWISQHVIRYYDEPDKIHYCENNVCYYSEGDFTNLDPTTRFYNDGRVLITHKYDNSERDIGIEENIFFETLDDWNIYSVKLLKNSFEIPTLELTMQYQNTAYAHLKQLCFKEIENTSIVDFRFIYNSPD